VTAFFRVSDDSQTLHAGFECRIYKYQEPIHDEDTGTVYRYRHHVGAEAKSAIRYPHSQMMTSRPSMWP
jgi:hypothetical protein